MQKNNAYTLKYFRISCQITVPTYDGESLLRKEGADKLHPTVQDEKKLTEVLNCSICLYRRQIYFSLLSVYKLRLDRDVCDAGLV